MNPVLAVRPICSEWLRRIILNELDCRRSSLGRQRLLKFRRVHGSVLRPASVDAALGGSIAFTATEDFDLHPEYFIDSGAAAGLSLEFTSVQRVWPLQSPSSLCSTMAWTTRLFEETVEWAEANIVPVQVHGCFGWPRPPSSQPSRLIDFHTIPREWWR